MKGIIIVGCSHLVAAMDLQIALASVDIKMPIIAIQKDIERPADYHERMIESLKLSALERCPEPVDYSDVFKKDVQPRFKFQNVRKIRK